MRHAAANAGAGAMGHESTASAVATSAQHHPSSLQLQQWPPGAALISGKLMKRELPRDARDCAQGRGSMSADLCPTPHSMPPVQTGIKAAGHAATGAPPGC
jgi:hypothetical protein